VPWGRGSRGRGRGDELSRRCHAPWGGTNAPPAPRAQPAAPAPPRPPHRTGWRAPCSGRPRSRPRCVCPGPRRSAAWRGAGASARSREAVISGPPGAAGARKPHLNTPSSGCAARKSRAASSVSGSGDATTASAAAASCFSASMLLSSAGERRCRGAGLFDWCSAGPGAYLTARPGAGRPPPVARTLRRTPRPPAGRRPEPRVHRGAGVRERKVHYTSGSMAARVRGKSFGRQ
jgi:hypothetical protein